MRLLHQTGAGVFVGLTSVSVQMQPGVIAELTLTAWSSISAAKASDAPTSVETIEVCLPTWDENTALTLLDLVATLPEFEGAEFVDTNPPAAVPTENPFEGRVYDVGLAPGMDAVGVEYVPV
jgi:hypothetical protein